MIDKELYDSAKQGERRYGKLFLLKHLKGERITQREAINAKCYDCCGMGEIHSCDTKSCALYPYSRYGGLRPTDKEGVLHPQEPPTRVVEEKEQKDEV